jgi:type VI secretion system protein ImpE
MPAQLEFENGGEALALIPTRYEGSENSTDGTIQLARKTEWRELAPNVWAGIGQRVLSSDAGEYALMDIREIVFDQISQTDQSDQSDQAEPGTEGSAASEPSHN